MGAHGCAERPVLGDGRLCGSSDCLFCSSSGTSLSTARQRRRPFQASLLLVVVGSGKVRRAPESKANRVERDDPSARYRVEIVSLIRQSIMSIGGARGGENNKGALLASEDIVHSCRRPHRQTSSSSTGRLCGPTSTRTAYDQHRRIANGTLLSNDLYVMRTIRIVKVLGRPVSSDAIPVRPQVLPIISWRFVFKEWMMPASFVNSVEKCW